MQQAPLRPELLSCGQRKEMWCLVPQATCTEVGLHAQCRSNRRAWLLSCRHGGRGVHLYSIVNMQPTVCLRVHNKDLLGGPCTRPLEGLKRLVGLLHGRFGRLSSQTVSDTAASRLPQPLVQCHCLVS